MAKYFAFAIRDDDTSALTTISELEEAWSWFSGPVTLAIVPHTVDFQVLHLPGRDTDRHQLGSVEHPVTTNAELVHFIRSQRRFAIALHGCNHRYEKKGQRLVAEYASRDIKDLIGRTARATRELRQAFGSGAKVFIPPDNAISQAGWGAIKGSEIKFVQVVAPTFCHVHPWVESPDLFKFTVRRTWIRIFHRFVTTRCALRTGLQFGAPILAKRGREAKIKQQVDYCIKNQEPITLATHYWEMADSAYRKMFQELVAWVIAKGGHPVTMDELYDL